MPFLVTGTPRSGTSMVIQTLWKAGAYVGDENDITEMSSYGFEHNKDGNFEHRMTRWVTEAVSQSLGTNFVAVAPIQNLPPRYEFDKKLDRYILHTQAFIKVMKFEAAGKVWGWKCPRAANIIQWWLRFIPDLKIIMTHRADEEVIQSMTKTGMTREGSINLLTVLRNHHKKHFRGLDFLVITYDEWFEKPEETILKATKYIGLENPDIENAKTAIKLDYRYHKL